MTSGALLDDEMAKRLAPKIAEIARILLELKGGKRPTILRFHHDADGIAGALALSGIFRFFAKQQNSAVYTVKDAIRDLNDLANEEKPLVVLLDFGMNAASAEALKLLKAGGITVIVIDHHPPSGGAELIPDFCLNPWEFQGREWKNPSAYVAGYLACEIAVACGADRERALSLARTACSGDKSDILASNESDVKKAMVLDFLASHVSFGNNLEFYRKVMGKSELFDSIARQADESIEEASTKTMAGMKKTESEGGLLITTLALEGIVKKGEWPSSSKITTRVFDKLNAREADTPLLCIGHTDRSLIMRLNDKAVALGLSANDLAETIKKSMVDFVQGGGGHVKAGAIRVREGFAKEVLGELLREAGRIARKDY
ncbi:hypothetical protein H0O00_01625 [Candidatus Micrarchaeota archaeon]|nr:hypothetical protein [Candidatus Micrarchaeota archaeon]